jgi:hypothetical protein
MAHIPSRFMRLIVAILIAWLIVTEFWFFMFAFLVYIIYKGLTK